MGGGVAPVIDGFESDCTMPSAAADRTGVTVTENDPRTECPACGYGNGADVPSCGMCGELLRRTPAAAPLPGLRHEMPGPPPAAGDVGFDGDRHPDVLETPRVAGIPEHWFYAFVGAALAPVLGLTPLLQYMGWFLRSLCHEMGHSTIALFFGMPAYPAIRIDGHAASIHQPQVMAIAVFVWAFVVWLVWLLRRNRPACIALAALALTYPLLAFTGAKELLHLLGGHLGELAFAAVFLWRALSGGFSRNPVERLLYGGVGWYLVGSNVRLCAGLAFSPNVRAWYEGSGSFGLTNDYLRISEDVLQVPLTTVAVAMLFVSLLTAPVAWLIWRLRAE